ncbi:MAG: pyridoxal-dependent decarboxylase [Planctomycetaceae bacterium]
MTPEEFRRYGHQIIDWIADYRSSLHTRPVMAQTKPGEVRSKIAPSPPVDGEPFTEVLKDLDEVVLPGLSLWQHPMFFGYFPANSSLASVLGDMLSTGLGVLGLAWQSSPALTEVEEVATDWLRQMLGLSDSWQGVIQDTASTSTLVALLSARERTSNYGLVRGGLQAEDRPLVVYVSAHSHSSVDKAALLAGFGRQNVRVVSHDANFGMCPESLDAAIHRDVSEGRKPCAVALTTGTTTTTAVDPLRSNIEAAKRHGLWVHVDSAMAGSAMILPECRWMWDGIEGADSIVVNPHKWMGAAFDCSVYYVKDAQHLVRVMSTNPSYLQTTADGQVKNYRDWGLPLGRRFRALKLWLLIREQGIAGLQKRLRRDLQNAQWLATQIADEPSWKVLAPVQLQTLCVRHEPDGVTGEELDRHTLNWVNSLNQSGRTYLTPATLNGRWMVRVSIGAENTEQHHVEALWQAMKGAVSA